MSPSGADSTPDPPDPATSHASPHADPALVHADLHQALADLLQRRPVLVALDFDGTLAPIVERPPDARPLAGTADLARRLAETDGVVVALVSGRSRDDLAAVSGIEVSDDLLLVGSHGTEIDASGPAGLDDAARRRLTEVAGVLADLSAQHLGAHVERKPASAVLHTRRIIDRVEAAAASEAAVQAVTGRDGLWVTLGKEVVEVAVIPTGKGAAVQWLRDSRDARAVLYVGDDVTDEDAFAVLGDGDVGVKVGAGQTLAAYRIADPGAVRDLLRTLLSLAVPPA